MADDGSTAAMIADNNDGSLQHAALAMPEFDDGLDDPSPASTRDSAKPTPVKGERVANIVPMDRRQNRADDGKYAEGFSEKEAAEADAPIDGEVLDGEVSDPVDEYVEIPGENEGDPPRRVKFDEVWQGYQEAAQLREYVEQIQRVTPPPPDYENHIYETVQTRGQLIRELQMLEQANQPMEPNLDLINENSPNYNPAMYQRQVQLQREQAGRIAQIRQRREQEEAIASQEQTAVAEARKSREQAKLLQFWPEIRDPGTQRQVRDEAARYYGIDDQIFATVTDARFYGVLRDALAYRSGLKQRQAAVKVVRAKPKLVKGSARNSSNPKQASFQTGMRALQKSGSVEDAAEAMGSFL